MMWTLIIVGLAFVIWRFMMPADEAAAPAAEAPPPPPSETPPEASSGGGEGESDPFKAPGG